MSTPFFGNFLIVEPVGAFDSVCTHSTLKSKFNHDTECLENERASEHS
jgi:hypothetical protein